MGTNGTVGQEGDAVPHRGPLRSECGGWGNKHDVPAIQETLFDHLRCQTMELLLLLLILPLLIQPLRLTSAVVLSLVKRASRLLIRFRFPPDSSRSFVGVGRLGILNP
jgi:hypothetical protein